MWSMVIMTLVVILAGVAIAALLAATRPSARPSPVDGTGARFSHVERRPAGVSTIGSVRARKRRRTVLHD
jgi:hypothetical protein